MAVRFPDTPQTIEPAEAQINYSYDHLTASINQGLAGQELCYPHGVAIDSNTNQIYLTGGYLSYSRTPRRIARVSVFSETGEFLNSFSHPHMEFPWGIAIHGHNLYVTDKKENSVFQFKLETEFRLIARLGGRGSNIGQFNDPGQLSVSTNGDIFVTDRYNHRVQILDSSLEYLRHISHHSMELPVDVKLTPDEVFVLCESSLCIYVFSYSRDLIRSLITRGLSIGKQVVDPSFFCLDADSNILFSDCFDNQIKIFSKEGTHLHTLGEEGHEVGMFCSPHGITLTNDLKLVIVSRNRYYSLQIYSFD